MPQYTYQIDKRFIADTKIVGAKGSGLIRLASLDIPVPPGFIITTDVYRLWQSNAGELPDQIKDSILNSVRDLELSTNRRLGDSRRPLLLSVRSGAPVSMPGMMATILNVGFFPQLLKQTTERKTTAFIYDTYCRFLVSYGTSVLNIPHDSFNAQQRHKCPTLADLEHLINEYLGIIDRIADKSVPSNPKEQIFEAIYAVFRSWDSPGAVAYRQQHLIADEMGTAVVIQQMVLGNRAPQSGSGVVYTRNLTNGERKLDGSYLLCVQGEDIVSGRSQFTPKSIDQLIHELPSVYDQLRLYGQRIENHLRWPQELEFTVEEGKLWILQTRQAPLTSNAAIRVAIDMVQEATLTRKEAMLQVPPDAASSASKPRLALEAIQRAVEQKQLLARGLGASPGLAIGPLITQAASLEKPHNPHAILIKDVLDPVHDVQALQQFQAFITVLGGTASHAATLARKLRKPYIAGCDNVSVDQVNRVVLFGSALINEGTIISIDGSSGNIFLGEVATIQPAAPFPELAIFKQWEKEVRTDSAWEVACYPDRDGGKRDFLQEASYIATSTPWRTDKAKAIELLRLIPSEYRIEQIVVNAKDKERIRQLMLEGVDKGFWIGPKCCYSATPKLGKGLWQMGIRTPTQVEEFLNDPDFSGLSNAGGYPKWVEDPNLEEIVVVYDPPQKGLPEYAHRHFFFTISCMRDPATVQIEMALGTSRVRLLEEAESNQLIHIRMELDFQAPKYRGPRTMVFGQSYFMSSALNELKRQLTEESKIDDKYISIWHLLKPKINEDSAVDERYLAYLLRQAMQTGSIADHDLGAFIEPLALRVAKHVTKRIFREWWTAPFELPYRMCALDAVFSLETLEFQGSYSTEGDVEYILLWDAKGREEALTVEK